MARFYPRFLFSTSTDTKSTGYFITHNLKPRGIIRLSEKFQILDCEFFDHLPTPDITHDIMQRGIDLLKLKISTGALQRL